MSVLAVVPGAALEQRGRGDVAGGGGTAPQPTVPDYTNDAQHGMIAYRRATTYAGLPAQSWTVVTMDGADHQVSTAPS